MKESSDDETFFGIRMDEFQQCVARLEGEGVVPGSLHCIGPLVQTVVLAMDHAKNNGEAIPAHEMRRCLQAVICKVHGYLKGSSFSEFAWNIVTAELADLYDFSLDGWQKLLREDGGGSGSVASFVRPEAYIEEQVKSSF